MPWTSPSLDRSRPFLLGAGALVAFALALAWGPRPPETGAPLVFPLLLACAMAGALHRPWGPLGLGSGAAALPLAVHLFGPAGAGLCAFAGGVAGGLWELSSAGETSRGWRRTLEPASALALGALAAAATWSLLAQTHWAAAVALGGGVYLGLLLAWSMVVSQRSTGGRRQPWRALGAAAVEGTAWAVGVLLVLALLGAGAAVSLGLLVALTLLTVEGARQGRLRHQSEAGRHALERLGRTGARLVRDPSPVADLAHQVHRECRQVIPFSWLSFELLEGAGAAAAGCWHAGPDGALRAGPPRPPEHPPPLPGIHRRAAWRVLRRSLVAGDRHLGELALWCDPRRAGEEEVDLLDRLVPQLAGLVLRSLLDREAREDPLTGAALRRVLDFRLAESWDLCLQDGGSLAVVLVDLDFFKRINDRHGHAAGDLALTAVAAVLGANLRERDLCARYGGEEFALLLDGLDGDGALAVAERLRVEVEDLEVRHEGETLSLSLSAGVASFPEVHAKSPQELLQLADAALYEAKRLGRNCCLLCCGPGRYVDSRGREIDTTEAEGAGAPSAPQFFA